MRLTNKKHQIYIDASLSPNYWLKPVADKLGQLEDIEDELKLSIIDFFKALEELPKENEKWNTFYINYKGRVYLIKELKELE